MTKKRVNVIGAGGHAKVVLSLLRDLGCEVAGVFDDDPATWNCLLAGAPVRGPVEQIAQSPRLPTIIAIGDNAVRHSIAARLDLDCFTAVHPRAHVDRSAVIGVGTVVMAGAIIQPDARLGRHVIVNTVASIDHDCVVDDFAHIAPGARLAGGVHIETGVLFGVGAVSIPGVRIGSWSTVGAGAAVVADIPANRIAKGIPAKPLSTHELD
jgi:sugar O-acyltransferase (sialic acid O-acetyltransferase NeuD family)